MSLPLDLSSYQRDPSLGTLEKQLICPICVEVFTKPVVILPCQHNLCRKCANELYKVGIGGRFRCPSCRHEVVLDRHGVYGLQRNLLVENIIDVYKQESAKSEISAKPPPKPVEQISCEEHEGEKLNIYCITCQVPTCSLCKVFGAHNTCQVAPLTDVYQQQKSELSDGISSVVASNEHIQACVRDLEEICRNIEENAASQKQILCEKFDRMSGILEERCKIMTQQITYEQDEKTGWVQSLVQTYSEHVNTNSKLVQTALNAMEEQDMPTFMQNSKSLIEKVSEATVYPPLETIDPGYENMDHYKVDFDAEESALYQLDFLQIEEEVDETPEEPDEETEPESESDSELQPEEKSEPEPEPGLAESLDSDQHPKSEHLERQSAVPEPQEVPQAKVEAKNALSEKSGLSTQQDQPELGCEGSDPGDLGIQCSPLEADETKFCPSWCRPNNRQMLSSNNAVPSDVSGVPNHTPELVRETSVQSQLSQTPLSMRMMDSLMPANNKENAMLEKDALSSPQEEPVSEVEKNVSDLGDGSANRDRASVISLQGESYSLGAQDSRETEQNTDYCCCLLMNSVMIGPSSSAITKESPHPSFPFSWLNLLVKK